MRARLLLGKCTFCGFTALPTSTLDTTLTLGGVLPVLCVPSCFF